MGLFKYILPRKMLIVVHFDSQSHYTLRLISDSHKFDGVEIQSIAQHKKQLLSSMLFVVLCGHGITVRSRTESPEIVDKILSDKAVFLSCNTHDPDQVCFVRRDQLRNVEIELQKAEVKILDWICMDEKSETYVTISKRAQITWRDAISTNTRGSTIAMHIYHRKKLIVLSILLAIVLLNLLFNSSLNEQESTLNRELATLKSATAKSDKSQGGATAIMRSYNERLAHRISTIADRIASLTPKEITLSELSIQKPLKALQSQHEPTIEEKIINIRGFAPQLNQINDLRSSLTNESFAKKTLLNSIDHDPSRGIFIFHILLEI